MQFTNTVSGRDIQRQYKKIFAKVKKTQKPIVVISDNKPQAAIVSLEMLEKYEKLSGWAIIDEIRTQNQGVDPRQVEKDVNQSVEAVRQEMYDKQVASSRR